MWISRNDLNLPDTPKGNEEWALVDEEFNLMVLVLCCGIPVIVAGIYILVRAWKVELTCVKMLCSFMIAEQVCYCSSRVIYLQALAEHYVQPNTAANQAKSKTLFHAYAIFIACYAFLTSCLHWFYTFKMWAVGEKMKLIN